jgi:hypothetical protein
MLCGTAVDKLLKNAVVTGETITNNQSRFGTSNSQRRVRCVFLLRRRIESVYNRTHALRSKKKLTEHMPELGHTCCSRSHNR